MEYEESPDGDQDNLWENLVIADINKIEPAEFTKKRRPDIGVDDPNGQIVNEYLFEE